jgi:hypothetical protein
MSMSNFWQQNPRSTRIIIWKIKNEIHELGEINESNSHIYRLFSDRRKTGK